MVSSRPLHDAPDRSYAAKLERFGRFVAPELRVIFAEFGLPSGARVLDVGCGVGHAVRLFADQLGSDATVVGVDLSMPHLQVASGGNGLRFVQADASRLCFRDATFDLIWSCNTINHLADPVAAIRAMRAALRPAGRLVLAQSGFLPEMYFPWDAQLDEAVRRACHEYYRQRYGLTEQATTHLRGLVGMLQRAGLRVGRVRTLAVERTQPLSAADREYFEDAVFRGTWGERLSPFMSVAEWNSLRQNIDPASSVYCLDRADFHHVQTLTVCEAHA
jgi:ubiquinone/menaquinone biosynthesis C-methylase UbiE